MTNLENKLMTKALANPKSNYIVRFSTLANALSYRNGRAKYSRTPIVLGHDGKFWLAPDNRTAGQLEKMGYEFA